MLRPHRGPTRPSCSPPTSAAPKKRCASSASIFRAEDVDMLTLVMVGSSQSKTITRGDGQTYAYTPRGYAKKMETCR
jgi:cobalt-precorrin 5A hydrolase/precorrin-3B C17-methyltransferase